MHSVPPVPEPSQPPAPVPPPGPDLPPPEIKDPNPLEHPEPVREPTEKPRPVATGGNARRVRRATCRNNDISSGWRGGLRSHEGEGGRTYDQLYNEAKSHGIEGRSSMTKAQLEKALQRGSTAGTPFTGRVSSSEPPR